MSTKRLLSTFAVGAALACGSVTASAAPLPFCVNDSSLGGVGAVINATTPATSCTAPGGETGFAVDLLQGSYVEKLAITGVTGPTSGTFSATILFDVNNYSYQGTTLLSLLDALPPPLGLGGYNLYALVQATGSFSGQSFTASTATLSIYGDAEQDAAMGPDSIAEVLVGGLLAYTAGGVADILLGSSSLLLSGSGTTAPAGGQDGFAVTFGEFALTNPDGEAFFIAPRPFYVNVYSDGDITEPTFDPAGGVGEVTTLQGEVSANFLIPEPGSLALVGLALAGLGFARRRKV